MSKYAIVFVLMNTSKYAYIRCHWLYAEIRFYLNSSFNVGESRSRFPLKKFYARQLFIYLVNSCKNLNPGFFSLIKIKLRIVLLFKKMSKNPPRRGIELRSPA